MKSRTRLKNARWSRPTKTRSFRCDRHKPLHIRRHGVPPCPLKFSEAQRQHRAAPGQAQRGQQQQAAGMESNFHHPALLQISSLAAITPLSGKSKTKAPNQFAIDNRGNTACQKPILPDNKTMSAQEILIEEIRRQPEPVAREVLHYLKFLEHQRDMEAPMDSLVADTREKLGPAPEVNYDQI
jgi:hypothetical protein